MSPRLPDDSLQLLLEDLTVPYVAGSRGADDGPDRRFDECLGNRHLDLHLVVELEHESGAPIVLHDFLLAAVAADAGEGHSGNAHLGRNVK